MLNHMTLRKGLQTMNNVLRSSNGKLSSNIPWRQVVLNSTHLKNGQLTLTKVTYSSTIRCYRTFQNYVHDILRVVPSSKIVPKAC